jgi:hypothetical protein
MAPREARAVSTVGSTRAASTARARNERSRAACPVAGRKNVRTRSKPRTGGSLVAGIQEFGRNKHGNPIVFGLDGDREVRPAVHNQHHVFVARLSVDRAPACHGHEEQPATGVGRSLGEKWTGGVTVLNVKVPRPERIQFPTTVAAA